MIQPFDGNIVIEGFGDLSESLSGLPLRGHVVLDMKDLSPLQTMTGDYLVPSGQVMADLVHRRPGWKAGTNR